MANGVRTAQGALAPCRFVEAVTGLLGRAPLTVHQLLFRLASASVFLPAGLLKLASWQSTIALFQEEYKVPLLSLLIAGLATRLATLPLLGQIATIQLFVYPQAWHEYLVWGSILLFLLTQGGGTISADLLLSRWFRAWPS
jgi:putative oxidoreductase